MPDTPRMKPEFNVYLDGTKLQGEEKGAISGVHVFLTQAGASAFEIVVDDPELKWQAKPTFTERKEVKIELGVPGKMKKVFDGEVTAWRTELERSGPCSTINSRQMEVELTGRSISARFRAFLPPFSDSLQP